DQKYRSSVSPAGLAEDTGKGLKGLGRIDPAGRIMRGIDDDRPRICRDRPFNACKVEVKGLHVDLYADRDAPRSKDHSLILEPGWAGEKHLISRLHDGAENNQEPAAEAVCQKDILLLERHSPPFEERFGHD